MGADANAVTGCMAGTLTPGKAIAGTAGITNRLIDGDMAFLLFF